MSGKSRFSNEEIISAYMRTGSVWKAGRDLGLAGQTVHGRLVAAGHKIGTRWRDDEIEELKQMAGSVTIGHLADHFGRSYAAIACKINELEIGVRFGNQHPRKIPRGQGYDKASVKKHIKALEQSGLTPTRYARQVGIKVDTFVTVVERHFPEWWAEYRKTISYLPEAVCPYCQATFYPSNTRHVYCTRKCQQSQRVDRDYFGGKRRATIGLAENTCQVCGRHPSKGMSSHHVYGKENDPDNEFLAALCQGCHKLVTAIGCRDFDEEQWQSLILFSWMRKHGDTFPKGELQEINVAVDIDVYPIDEDGIPI